MKLPWGASAFYVTWCIVFMSSAAHADCLDPDETTPSGRRMLDAGEPCKKTTPPTYYPIKSPRALPAAFRSEIMRYFDGKLIDGPGSRWKWPVQTNGLIYCGWVNPKNRFGGFVGWVPYYVFLEFSTVKLGAVVTDDASKFDAEVLLELCPSAGYDISEPPR